MSATAHKQWLCSSDLFQHIELFIPMNPNTRSRIAICTLLWLILVVGPTWAQTPATPAKPVTLETPVSVMQLSGFVITGNTLLPEDRLMKVLQPFKGERTMDELKQAALAVQDMYREAGYGAVIAYVPVQTATDGIATIAVMEGHFKRVEVIGNQRFSRANILRSLPLLKPGLTPQVRRIDAQIQLANENPAKQVAVLLEAGEQQGDVDAHITVTEAATQRWIASLDNTGNVATGRLRTNLTYLNSDLWDLDHQLTLQFQFAPDKISSVAVLSANYHVPFYAQGLALDTFVAHSTVDGGNSATAAGPLQFSGKGDVIGARLSKYLERLGELDHRILLGLDRRAYINKCSILGLPAGACGSAGENITVHPLSLEYSLKQPRGMPMGFDVSISHNLALGGTYGNDANFDVVRADAKRRYTNMRFNIFAGHLLGDQWQVQARVAGQFTQDALVSGEQFGLGGSNSVRGYGERELQGDSGISGSAELYTPDFAKAIGETFSSVRMLAFVDAGRVKNRLETFCRNLSTSCSLLSAGAGLRLGAGPSQFRFDVAQSLRSAVSTKRNDISIHFQASYSFL